MSHATTPTYSRTLSGRRKRGGWGQNGPVRNGIRRPSAKPMTTAPDADLVDQGQPDQGHEQRQTRVGQELAGHGSRPGQVDATAQHGLDVALRREKLACRGVHGGHARASEQRQQHGSGDQGRHCAKARGVVARPVRLRPIPVGQAFPEHHAAGTREPDQGQQAADQHHGPQPSPVGLVRQRLQDQDLADEARQGRQAHGGDGAQEEQAGQEIELGEGRCATSRSLAPPRRLATRSASRNSAAPASVLWTR